MNVKKLLQPDFRAPYHPWPYFLLFLCIQFFLTHFLWSLTARLSILAAGILLPLFWIAATSGSETPQGESSLSLSLPPSKLQTLLWIFPVLALLIYFGGLGTPLEWVGGDSIQPGVYAIDLLHHWNWHFFETFGQTPSTGSYLCWAFLKLTGLPLLSYQLPCALLMVLAAFTCYQAVRLFFPPLLSLTFLCLLAINQWSFELTRSLIFLPLWEGIVFYICGKFYLSTSKSSQILWAALLGISFGLGPFAFPSWPILAPLVAGLVVWKVAKDLSQGIKITSIFLLAFLLAMTPFGLAVLQSGYGSHILKIGIWNGFSLLLLLENSAQYLMGLFWNSSLQPESWEGGFLNLFYSSFFLLGLIELFRARRQPPARFIAVGILLLLIPGILSNTVEFNRILLVLPLLGLVSAFGIYALAAPFTPALRTGIIGTLLLFSCGWDLVHFTFPPATPSLQDEVQESKNFYALLEPMASQKGPGLIFSQLIPITHDYSLYYYTYPFNALLNPSLSMQRAQWCALVTDRHYQPLLLKLFPDSQWISLPTSKPGVSSRHILFLIAVTPFNRPALLSWKATYDKFQEVDFQILNLGNGKPRKSILKNLLDYYPCVSWDPFLQSCYFEKLLFLYSWEKTFYPEDSWTNWTKFSRVFQNSFGAGFQDPELCEKFGRLLVSEGQTAQAKDVFIEALKLSPGNPWLLTEIQQLGLDSK